MTIPQQQDSVDMMRDQKDPTHRTAEPVVINIQTKRWPLAKFILAALLLTVLVVVVFGVGIGTIASPSPVMYILSGILLVFIIALIAWPWQRKMRDRVEAIVTRNPDGDLSERVQEITRLYAWTQTHPPIRTLPDVLIKQGRFGMTLQVWRKAEPKAAPPLTMMFEPRLLDEANEGFDELDQAAAIEGQPSAADPLESSTHRTDRLAGRHISRNVKLKGGWIVVAVFAVNVVIFGIQSLQRGMITWQFLLWLALFLVTLFSPLRTGLFASRQWLLVPGGLLLRKAKRHDRKVTLHLFDRRRSVLCAYQHRRGIWLLTIADAETSETTMITDRERNLLLRAWLSPREPPPVEKLGDWA